MNITDEIYAIYGFKKETSVGGFKRWYYKKHRIPKGIIIKSPGSTDLSGNLGIDVVDKGKEDNTQFKTLEDIHNYMMDLHYKIGEKWGEENVKLNLRILLGLED